MFIESVTFFLGVSILFYCLFAGADFGAGILECFLGTDRRDEQRDLISHAIAPVWEANHVWLVLVVVILFNGFPKAYSALSTYLHIPLTFLLLGVILRGCAFTFRQYDARREESQKIYSAIFMISSVLTPMMLGIVAGATLLGKFALPHANFYETFVSPWLNLFCFCVGLLTCTIFTFLAAVYLIGETTDIDLRSRFIRQAKCANLSVVITGAFVFLSAEWYGLNLIGLFSSEFFSLSCMALATILLFPLWKSLNEKAVSIWTSRLLAGAQMSLVLLGWFNLQFPTLLGSLSVYNSAAPESVLLALLIALFFGIALIFPALFYLLWIFKRKKAILK